MIRTSEGKLVLFDVETGQRGEFWPIDAKALIEQGSHSASAPEGADATPPVMPPERVGVPAAPSATQYAASSGKVARPTDPEALPPGYEAEHAGAGYYVLTAPGAAVVEGPSKGKFQGKDGAADGAWAHYLSA